MSAAEAGFDRLARWRGVESVNEFVVRFLALLAFGLIGGRAAAFAHRALRLSRWTYSANSGHTTTGIQADSRGLNCTSRGRARRSFLENPLRLSQRQSAAVTSACVRVIVLGR